MRTKLGVMRCFAVALLLVSCTKSEPETNADDKGKAPDDAKTTTEAVAPQKDEQVLPAAEAILDKAVQAVGGADKLAAIESFYYQSEIEILGQKIEGGVEIWWKNGDFYTEQDMRGVGKVRAGKLGDEIWSEDPISGLRKLTGTEAEQHKWASSLQLAADWKRYFDRARTIAKRDEGGKTIYDVELVAESGATVTMSFDAETGLQIGQTFKQSTPMGEIPVTVTMEDYREVEGVKIAHRQVTDAGLAKAVQTITKIEVNLPVSESRFAMPRSGADVVKQNKDEPAEIAG